jgi:hypothetical protein
MVDNQSKTERDADTININRFTTHLESLGYKIIQLSQVWRHVTGKVIDKDGNARFIKLGSTELISQKTKNEFAWNQYINSSNLSLKMKVPQVFEFGEFEGLFWFTSEFIEGQPLCAQDTPFDLKLLTANIPLLIDDLYTLSNIPSPLVLPNDNSNILEIRRARLLSSAEDYANKLSDFKLQDLLNFLKERIKSIELSVAHNDFVPWHILVANENLYLIDGERSSQLYYRHNDFATFYHRLQSVINSPEIANTFVQDYIERLKLTPEDMKGLEAVLAHRLLGGFWETTIDKRFKIDTQQRMMKILLDGELSKN